jgi:small subunit ribosomal protein S16
MIELSDRFISVSEQWRCILLSIRLTRRGAKKKPFYRIIVTEKRSKRDGRFVESVGYYDPCRNPADIKIDRERVNYWIERGAQPSETVRSLIKRSPDPSSVEVSA